MTKEQAQVVEVGDDFVVVSSQVKSACHQCHQNETCGSGIVAKALPHRAMTLSLPKTNIKPGLAVDVGDLVVIALPEKALLSSAFQVYLFPVMGLILFGFIGQWLLEQAIIGHELVSLAIAVIGGYLGFQLAKWRQNQLACQVGSEFLTPSIIARVSPKNDIEVIDITDK